MTVMALRRPWSDGVTKKGLRRLWSVETVVIGL